MSGRKVMAQPINILFTFLQKQTPVTIWLYDNTEFRITGTISGFDEFMNVVISDAVMVYQPKKDGSKDVKPSEQLGRILLKGDNITLIQPVQS
ncbi:hypothetical protein BD324DRAFT_624496 [Kockovaella imperatae]|uniref:Small nuclear ribonucleoprotein E n=1 Tax=Kockovaella imperatae TaxID=4999 RepID=A0A1Y1UG26_9TREE|nr:hypothetical protein BD324DRAFT_624496 [Kockovaella imperatae]ORX37020.1 hypothetical protein BD324DRAFT_624496 [Kockovaella imperatae]